MARNNIGLSPKKGKKWKILSNDYNKLLRSKLKKDLVLVGEGICK